MASSTETAPFTPEAAVHALVAACERAGLPDDGAELLRLGENALFRLRDVPVVVRVARSAELLPDVAKEVAVARWLEGADFPAVRLVAGLERPLIVTGRIATFWRFIEASGPDPSIADLGSILARLHALARPPSVELPPFDPFGRVAARLDRAHDVSVSDRGFLRQLLAELRERYAQLDFALPPGHIHGDAHPGNLLRGTDGKLRLLDFERFALGPHEWDISIAGMQFRNLRWISQVEYRAFVDAYGYDVTGWPGFEVLRRVRELTMTTWLMQNVGHNENTAREFTTRMVSLRDRQEPRTWRPF